MSGPRVPSWLERIGGLGRWLEDALLVVGLAALIGVGAAQILLRNVFSVGLIWADGLSRLLVLWLALLGAAAASRDRRHIAVDVADRVLPPRLGRGAAFVRELFTGAVCGALAWYSWVFVRDSREFGDVLLGWPAWWFQIILPIGFAVMAYRHLLRAMHAAAPAPAE